MLQVKTFCISAGANQPIGTYIDKEINPALATLKNAKVVSADVDMMGSYQRATVIVSFETGETEEKAVEPIDEVPPAEPKRKGRPPKAV